MSEIKAIVEQVKNAVEPSDEDKAKSLEQLSFLQEAATAKLDIFEEQLKQLPIDPQALGPIPIAGTPVEYKRAYQANVEKGVSDGVKKAVKKFFQLSEDGVKDAFEGIVTIALDTILGRTSVGEQADRQTLIALEHNAIVRVDVMFWRYNFSAKGIISEVESAFCYAFCKSIVDLHKIGKETLVYFVSKAAGDKNVDVYLDKLKEYYDKAKELDAQTLRDNYVKVLGRQNPESGRRHVLA